MHRSNRTKVLVVIAMVFPFLTAYFQYVVMFQDESVRWVYTLNKIIQFTLPMIYWLWDGEKLRMPPLPSWPQAKVGLLTGIGAFLIVIAAYSVLTHFTSLLDQTPESVSLRLHSLGVHTVPVFVSYAVFLSLIHSGLEEYYWRAFVFKGSQSFIPFRLAAPLSALAFTLHHIILIDQYAGQESKWLVVVGSLAVFVAGCTWAQIYRKTGNIYVCWLSHIFADLSLMWIGLQMFEQVHL